MSRRKKTLSLKTSGTTAATSDADPGNVSWQELGQARSHQTYLAQCDAWQTTSKELRRLVKEYGKLVHQSSVCLQEMAKTFSSLLESTQIWQAAVAFQQAADTAEESAKKFRVQLVHDVLGTLRGFTELLPAVASSVAAHKKSAAEVDSSQSHLEAVQSRHASTPTSLSPIGYHTSDGGSCYTQLQAEEEEALGRLQIASVSFANEDSKLATVWSALEETRKKLVGAALVASLNCMSWRSKHNSDLFMELGKFQDVAGLEQSIVKMDPIRHASGQWQAISKSNGTLRDKSKLTTNDIQCLTLCRSEDDMPDEMRENLCARIDQHLDSYMTEFNALPANTVRVPGGFHMDADGIEKALKNCCTELEARAAGFSGLEMSDPEALRRQMLLDLPRSQCTIGGCLYDSAPYNEASRAFDDRMRAVRELVERNQPSSSSMAKDGGGSNSSRRPLNSEELDQLSVYLLSHTCHTITNGAAKTAVQLVFGKAHLVLVKPSSDHRHQRAGLIDISKQQLTVTVPSTWWIVEDAPTFGPVRPNTDLTKPLGVVNANYQIVIDLTSGSLDEWKQTLPVVEVQRQGTSQLQLPKHVAHPRTLQLADGGQLQPSKLLRNSLGSLKSAVRKVRQGASGPSSPTSAEEKRLSMTTGSTRPGK